MTLYDMGVEYNALIDELECAESDDQRDALLAEMEKLNASVSDKATAYAKVKRNLEAEIDALKTESTRLSNMAKAKEKVIERLKKRMQTTMEMTGAMKIQTEIGSWSLRQNPPKCIIKDVWKVPAQYIVPQDPKVDSRAILNCYKETGEIVDGVDIVAEKSVQFR